MSTEKPTELRTSSSSQSAPARPEVAGGGMAIGVFGGIVWALLGGVALWAVVQASYPWFMVPPELAAVSPLSHPELLPEAEAARKKALTQNSIAVVALLGALVGGALAVGDGVKRRSPAAALAAGAASAVVGAALGSLAGFVGDRLFGDPGLVAGSTPLDRTVQSMAAALAILGGGVGLGAGASCGRRVRTAVVCVVGGVATGAFAGMVYPLAASVLLPAMQTELLVPEEPINRLLWIGVISFLLGLGVPGLGRKRPPSQASARK